MAGERSAHARRLHADAQKEWNAWLARLGPEGRAKLEKLGVLSAPDDSSEVGGHSPWQVADIADSSAARIEPEEPQADTAAELLAEAFGIPLALATRIHAWHAAATRDALLRQEGDLLAIVVGGLISAENPRISAAGLAYAANLDATNGLGSMHKFAKGLGVSRQAISKSAKAWQRSLNLTPSPHQKSAAACELYSANGKTNHWRRQKVNAAELLKRIRRTQSDPSQS